MSAFTNINDVKRKTKRYSIGQCNAGLFKIIDDRYLLDHLLGLPELVPQANDCIRVEFEEVLEGLSVGPTLTEDDRQMLGWLTTTVDVLDPNAESETFNTIRCRRGLSGNTWSSGILFASRGEPSRPAVSRYLLIGESGLLMGRGRPYDLRESEGEIACDRGGYHRKVQKGLHALARRSRQPLIKSTTFTVPSASR